MAATDKPMPAHWIFTGLDRGLTGEVLSDPLGLISIWAYLGNKLVPNLTTVSNHVRFFHTALLALERIAEWESDLTDDEKMYWNMVCAMEELVVHVQMRDDIDNTAGLRGVRKAKGLAGEKSVLLGQGTDPELLSSQKNNGMFAAVKGPLSYMGMTGESGMLSEECLGDFRKYLSGSSRKNALNTLGRILYQHIGQHLSTSKASLVSFPFRGRSNA